MPASGRVTSHCPPEDSLAAIRRWRDPAELSWQPIAGGRSNRSWRVSGDGQDYVLRLSSGRVPAPVSNPRRESIVHRAAAAAGLAPEVVHADPDAGILVTRFLAGEVVPAAGFRAPDTLRAIGRLLRRVRELPDPGGAYTLAMAGEAYLARIRDAGPRAGGERLVADLRGLSPPDRLRVCHMDPVAGNLVRTDAGLRLIDWEFAVAGDPLFDVAAVVAYHGLDAAASRCLLAAWADDPDDALAARLERLVWAHDALHWLWLVATGAGPESERRRLERRLDMTVEGTD